MWSMVTQLELSTVNAIFLKSLAIADELETECILLTFDLAFYAKTQKVRWNHDLYMQRTVVKLGKRFEDSGMVDILLEAGTVVQGSLPWVMKGRHYN